jgi:hypothetical protein
LGNDILTWEFSVKKLLPSDDSKPDLPKEELASDLQALETGIKVTVHLRVVILETFHICERMGDTATSGERSYGSQLLATLPYQTISMLVDMKIIEWSLALRPAELRPDVMIHYLERVLAPFGGM